MDDRSPDAGFAVRLAAGSLATWRLTNLLAREDGPGDLVARAREKLGTHPIGELMDCFGCLSIWVAAAFTPYVARRRSDAIVTALALAGAAGLLDRLSAQALEPVEVSLLDDVEERDGMLR